jgi:glycosyltransferase involved in cell wall biosynthesis
MNVLFVSSLSVVPWGGSEELWSLAALRMAEAGHRVSVLVHEKDVPIARLAQLGAAGCRIDYYHQERRLSLPARIGQGVLRLFSEPAPISLARSLQINKPDLVVHSLPYHLDGIEDLEKCRLQGVPYLIVVQAVSPYIWMVDYCKDQFRTAYSGALMCCFVSDGNRHEAEVFFGQRFANARIVRNPFNVPYDAAPSWPSSDGVIRLACVGRLDPDSKGQDILFNVLARPAWRDRRLTVSLVGKGLSEKTLRRLVEMFDIADRVQFQGFASDIVEVWANHHALILPSRSEGLPLAVVEAMLCGRICIVTDVAGNRELLEDNITGFVAKAAVPDLVDEALERAWRRRHEWQDMGKVAAQSVRKSVPPDPVSAFVSLISSLS